LSGSAETTPVSAGPSALPDAAQTTTGGVVGVGRDNPGIGRPLRLAGRRLDAAGIHRQWGDKP